MKKPTKKEPPASPAPPRPPAASEGPPAPEQNPTPAEAPAPPPAPPAQPPDADTERRLAEIRHVVTEAKQLSTAVGEGRLTDHLASWVAGRFALAARQLEANSAADCLDMDQLHGMCADLAELRRGDHTADYLRIARERLELHRENQKHTFEDRCREWSRANRDEIFPPEEMTPAERERCLREFFGLKISPELAQAAPRRFGTVAEYEAKLQREQEAKLKSEQHMGGTTPKPNEPFEVI